MAKVNINGKNVNVLTANIVAAAQANLIMATPVETSEEIDTMLNDTASIYVKTKALNRMMKKQVNKLTREANTMLKYAGSDGETLKKYSTRTVLLAEEYEVLANELVAEHAKAAEAIQETESNLSDAVKERKAKRAEKKAAREAKRAEKKAAKESFLAEVAEAIYDNKTSDASTAVADVIDVVATEIKDVAEEAGKKGLFDNLVVEDQRTNIPNFGPGNPNPVFQQ